MRIDWDQAARHYYQGIDRAVLYSGDVALPWSGLVSVDQQETDTIDTEYYIDGVRRLVLQENGDFGAHISAYTYPSELDDRTGPYGFTYRNGAGEYHEIHIVYNAIFQPSSRSFNTLSSGANPSLIDWDLTTTRVELLGSQPVAHFIVDTSLYSTVTDAIEALLYGSDTSDPRLPTVPELMDIFEDVILMRVTYNGDGTYTVSGADQMVQAQPDGTFYISSPTAQPRGRGDFTVSSY